MKVVWAERAETRRGPEEWFAGTIWMDVTPGGEVGVRDLRVLFEPGTRTNWHTRTRRVRSCTSSAAPGGCSKRMSRSSRSDPET
jgi:hypothetical protein